MKVAWLIVWLFATPNGYPEVALTALPNMEVCEQRAHIILRELDARGLENKFDVACTTMLEEALEHHRTEVRPFPLNEGEIR